MSFIASEASGSLWPKIRSKRRIFTFVDLYRLEYMLHYAFNMDLNYLKKRIANTTDIMFGRIAGENKIL